MLGMLLKANQRFIGRSSNLHGFQLIPFSSVAIAQESPKRPADRTYPKTRKEQHAELLQETLDPLMLPGTLVDSSTCASVLRACGNHKALPDGQLFHALIVESGHDEDTFLGSLIVQMYGKCGALDDASAWFAKMDEHDVPSWNFLIGAYARHGQCSKALELFGQMQREGLKPDKFTFIHLLSACASQAALLEGKKIHALIKRRGLESDVVIGTGLVNLYGKCGSSADARTIFDKMPKRSLVSWNAMIAAYARLGHNNDAIQLFERMQRKGLIPDRVTFISILQACNTTITEGKRMHTLIVYSGLESDLVVATALVNMYSKCSCLEDARRMFEKIPQRNVVSWTAMIAAYAQCGEGMEALFLFIQMQREGVMPDNVTFISVLDACETREVLPEGKQLHTYIVRNGCELDVVVATAFVNMYGKCGSLEDARTAFQNMPERNVISWNAIISVLAQCGQGKEALQLFEQILLEGIVPDKVTSLSVLEACASQEALHRGKHMHTYIMQSGFEADAIVGTALVNMYGRCGSLKEAERLFGETPKLDIISWTTMIAAHAQHGHGAGAIELFDRMQHVGITADELTMVSLLSACSRAGLLDEDCQTVLYMNKGRGNTHNEKHLDCIIDVLARAGRLDEAEELIHGMPFQPTAVTWMTLLGACRNQLDVERGERVARHVSELDPWTTASYVMLSSIYTSSGKGNESETLTIKMLDQKH